MHTAWKPTKDTTVLRSLSMGQSAEGATKAILLGVASPLLRQRDSH